MLVNLLISILLMAGGIWLFRHFQSDPKLVKRVLGLLMALVGLVGFSTPHFVLIGADETGHLKRVFLGKTLPQSHVIARDGELGPQAEVLGPGLHVRPFIRVLNDIEILPVLDVPNGSYAMLIAKDGVEMPQTRFIAPSWAGTLDEMLDAENFLTNGGMRGPQLTVLPPGRYRLNSYLFDARLHQALDVPTGHVAVIRSNVADRKDCPDPVHTAGGEPNAALAAPIVPKGCVGVWNEPVPPGRYYMNSAAYVPEIVPTRAQVWTYKGGYVDRTVQLTLGEDGSITQQFFEQEMDVPKDAADRAINVRVEGWTFPVELRVVAQVRPEDAPRVVATVGDLQKVEDAIITPTLRDILRTIAGHPNRKVMDFVEKRDELMTLVEQAVVPEGRKAGVSIQEVRLGEPAIPPELMVARLREQLANQMKATYIEEQKAQAERVEVKKRQALADQQPRLVEAEIAKQAAEHRREQMRLEGEGEKLKLMEIATGQEKQREVLGADHVFDLQLVREVLAVAAEHPDIIKVPTVQVVGGEGGSMEGAAAVLGASNFARMFAPAQTGKPGKEGK